MLHDHLKYMACDTYLLILLSRSIYVWLINIPALGYVLVLFRNYESRKLNKSLI